MVRGRLLWWILAACIAAFFGATAWNIHINQEHVKASAFFSSALREQHISEHVVVSGIVYTMSDGQVARDDGSVVTDEETFNALHIAYARTVTRRSPLMSLEGSDADMLERALAELQSVQLELSSAQSKSADARTVRSALYPVDFLKAAARMERARQTFLASGHAEDWESYQTAQTDTVRAYQSDARKFSQAFTATVPESSARLGIAGGRTLSRASELEAIGGIERNAVRLHAMLEKRRNCVSGDRASCDVDDTALPTVVQTKSPATSAGSPELAEEVKRILIDATRTPAQQMSVKLTTMPLPTKPLELSESACIGPASKNRMFLARVQQNAAGTWSLFLTFVGDILITDANSFSGTYYFDYFIGKGITYIPYWPTSTYTCPELGSEDGIVLALLATEDAARLHPFSPLLSHNKTDLKRIEKTLANGSVIRESDVRQYLALVRQSILLDPTTATDVQNRYISLALQLNDRSAGMPDLIWRLAGETSKNLRNLHSDVPAKLDAPYLFFVRSSFFSLLMGDNPSFAPERVLPYEPITTSPADQPYLLYSKIRSTVPLDKLQSDIRYMVRLEGWNE